MSEQSLAQQTLAAIERAGFDKAACRVSTRELHELQAETGEINLFRTNFETDIGLVGIDQQRRATLSLNKTDESTVGVAINDLRAMAAAANPDPAYDISEAQAHETFSGGIESPDYDAMYDAVVDFQKYVAATYPTLQLRSVATKFVKRCSCYVNSNDVAFQSTRGWYEVSLGFSSKEGSDASSMMYTGYDTLDLSKPIYELGNVDQLLRESTEQVRTQHIPAKFVGDLVMTPNCLLDFLGFLLARVNDGPMISGTSVFSGKLGEMVASTSLSIHSRPRAKEMTSGYWITGDGFKADNLTILDRGRLNSYLLGLYGANRLGLARAANSGGCYVVDPGDRSYDELIGDVKEGILITRFSGGRPNDRGDFSGVAKNSYYVKDGKVQYPIKETTVSGNLVDLLQSVEGISREQLDFGDGILPWVRVSGITAS